METTAKTAHRALVKLWNVQQKPETFGIKSCTFRNVLVIVASRAFTLKANILLTISVYLFTISGHHTLHRYHIRHSIQRALSDCSTLTNPNLWPLAHCGLWPLILNSSPAETPEQVARHEVSPGVGSPGLRGGGASGPGEGGLHWVGAVLREEGTSTSLPPPRPAASLLC